MLHGGRLPFSEGFTCGPSDVTLWTQRWFPSSQKRSSLNFTSSQRCQLSDVSDGQVSLGFHRSESDVTSSSLAADLVLRGPLLRRLEKQIQLENIWCFRKSFHAGMRDRDRS